MALDHYVSQVHLKQFLRQTDKKLLNAARKSDLSVFTPRPRDVCRVEDGSTNKYLTDNRAVEDFLKEIEPAYEPCLARVFADELDWKSRHVFSGFLAYIQTYTPAALRMFDPMTRAMLERTVRLLEESGELEPIDLPELPDWHGKTMSQLTKEGKVKLNIDLRMPQAMATTQLLKVRQSLASSDVTILKPAGSSRFLTSDFPSVILAHHQNKFAQRFLPLSPKLGSGPINGILISGAVCFKLSDTGSIQCLTTTSGSLMASLPVFNHFCRTSQEVCHASMTDVSSAASSMSSDTG